ncbi:hypothetical protein RN001_003969 [Aquatica leii]|uniref:Protein FAM114A2 n=1 Tax=Aquatica leii TaxID=1421715 RepID=A0AAN7SRS2_9COLE|nr:hypothetical protein RN001_003969 [Aquatica leii]
METSDSECFESADEEFYPESNNKKPQKQESIASVVEQIEELKVVATTTTVEEQPTKEIKNKTVKTNKLGVKVNKVSPPTETKEIPETINKNEETIPEQSKDEINLWDDDDDWEPVEQETKSIPTNLGWSSWGNWDVTSLLNTASAGVTTITNHVSHGLTSVLESGIGAPDPEELARINSSEKPKFEDGNHSEPINLSFGLSNFVSGVTHITKLVETTGNKVVKGGLDTLETIGKKTMEVLQEGDPGFKKKRAFLKINSNKPVLSHILREAKEKAEVENKLLEERQFARKANYESLFDDHQGLVHLEALEMLSKQCDIKLQSLLESLTGDDLIELQETMNQIEELCELVDDDDELEDTSQMKEKLDGAVSEMHINISYEKLLNTWSEAEDWLRNINLAICSEVELHEQAIDTLAQLTALAVERFHKIGELLLVKEHRSTADEADSLVQLTVTVTTLISHVATKLADKFNEKLTTSTYKDEINKLITNIYFESANSISYIKNAFQLLIPVLQVGAI